MTAPRKFRKSANTFIFELQLRGAKYSVWRIVEVSNKITLHELHLLFQVAMGWTCTHHYEFVIKEKRFQYPFNDNSGRFDSQTQFEDSTQVKIGRLGLQPGSSFSYIYDFGDYWQHDVILKSASLPQDSILKLPICSAGAMACPPENIGGIEAYNALVYMRLSGLKISRYEYLLEFHRDFDLFIVNSIRCFGFAAMVKSLRKRYNH